jgi:hypothetical protein
MKVDRLNTPREFSTQSGHAATLRHCANIELQSAEQVTFVGSHGGGYDVVRTPWGYYATPSLNGRLRDHGLRAALVRNPAGRAYVLLVERGREAEFDAYLQQDGQRLIGWLDQDETIDRLEDAMRSTEIH